MPSHKAIFPVLSALSGPSVLLGLACAFAVPQEAAAQFRAYGYYGYGPYYGGAYGPGYYYDGPYRRHGYYYGPDEADLGPDPYRDVDPAPAPRRPVAGKSASPDTGKSGNKGEAQKTEAKTNEALSREAIEKKVESAGYRLIAKPRRNGEIYLAWGEDNKANRRRLVYDAFDGHLIENTVLAPAKPNKAAGKAE